MTHNQWAHPRKCTAKGLASQQLLILTDKHKFSRLCHFTWGVSSEVPAVLPVVLGLPRDCTLQGYLADKKHPLPRTLREEHINGPMMILVGWKLPMSEVPLYGYVRETG